MAQLSPLTSSHQIKKSMISHRLSREADTAVTDSGRTQGDGEQQHDEEYDVLVARKAFELFERRGGDHGHDVDDWLEAERLVKGETF